VIDVRDNRDIAQGKLSGHSSVLSDRGGRRLLRRNIGRAPSPKGARGQAWRLRVTPEGLDRLDHSPRVKNKVAPDEPVQSRNDGGRA
jgi:hypothetical protein